MKQRSKGWAACLLRYAEGKRRYLAAAVLLSVVSVAAGLLPYYCIFRMLEAFAAARLTRAGILYWCGLSLLAGLVKSVFFGLSTGLSHHAAYHILERLRLRVADRFLHAPLGEVTAHSIGEIKNILVDKIEEIEPPLAHMIPEGAGHLVLPLVSLLALLLVDGRVALASLATVPFSLLCMALTFQISGKNFDRYNAANAHMNSMIVEYVEGIEVIKTFGQTGACYEKYAKAIEDYRALVIRWLSSTWVTIKLAFAIFPTTLVGTLPVSLLLAGRGALAPAQAALCVMLSMSMVGSLAKLEVFSNSIKQVQMTVEELEHFLELPELPEPDSPAALSGHDVELENVRFSYTGSPENEVLHGVSLRLPQGSFTALVGPSGGGKSTVARLIARFWDTTGGIVRIGGVPVQSIPLLQLAGLVSFVTQDNFLFQCSLRENIRLGDPDASDEQVYAAARAAQCDGFIAKLPQGYDTPAGEAGKRLSGGEKQRIAIARMILKDAPIVILDEATAFADPENEEKLQQSIAALTRGKTLLVIAHRLSTIRGADRIAVLQDGTIVAQGDQAQLLADCPLYRQMWQAHIGAKDRAISGKEGARHV